jgi:hydroxymethylpyrimidine/phosphomethylpyrimidine kinase
MGKRRQVGTLVQAGVLTIAGSDSGGGAGIQADACTIRALGGHALAAVTAVTAQNTLGIRAWRPVPPDLIRSQIEAVLDDFSVRAVKTGLLPSPAAIRAVGSALARMPRLPLVVDPVIGSSSGTRFLSPEGVRTLKRVLLPRAALVTPNWPEAAALAGRPVCSFAQAEEAARRLLTSGCRAVLVKGGHGPGPVCRDFLATSEGRECWFESARVGTGNTHGTGCVLSSAIACFLARGDGVEAAVDQARRFLLKALETGRTLRWGRGAGPAFG